MKKNKKTLFLLGAVCALTGCSSSSATISVSYDIAAGFARNAIHTLESNYVFAPKAITITCSDDYKKTEYNGNSEEYHSTEKFIYSEKDNALRLVINTKTTYVYDGVKNVEERASDAYFFYDSEKGIVAATSVKGTNVFTPNYYAVYATKEDLVAEMNAEDYSGSFDKYVKEQINLFAYSKFMSEVYLYNRYSDVSSLSNGDDEEMFLAYFLGAASDENLKIDYKLNGDNLHISASSSFDEDNKFPGGQHNKGFSNCEMKMEGMYVTNYKYYFDAKNTLYYGSKMETVSCMEKEEVKSSIKFEGSIKTPNLKDYIALK